MAAGTGNGSVLSVRRETFPMMGTFRISRGARTEAVVVVATVERDGIVGHGECVPYARYGETVDGVAAAIEAMAPAIADGLDREGLQEAMPAGAARNAIDCAFWDWEAKAAGKRVWDLAGLAPPVPVNTAFTISLDTVEAMANQARGHALLPLLKLKVTGEGDLDRVRAIRENAPRTRLIVDANEAWTPAHLHDFAPAFADLGVEMIEQPLPAGDDAMLADFKSPVPIGADEACHDVGSLDALVGKYQVINIKLDKTGGLTEALKLKAAAVERGFDLMVGCMVGTSLAMAPATLVAQGARFVDLDGPLLLAHDRDPGLKYATTLVHPPEASFWG